MKRKIIAVLIFILFVLPVPAVLLVPETVQNDFLYRLSSGPEVALSRSYLSALQSGDFAKILHDLDPKYRPSTTPKLLKQVQALLPPQPLHVRLMGYSVSETNGRSLSWVTWENVYADHAVLTAFSLHNPPGATPIWGFDITSITEPVEVANALSFHGKGGWYYLFSAVTALIWLFWLYTLYVWLYTDMGRRRTKILWGLAVLCVCLPEVSLNWSSGVVHFAFVRLGIAIGLVHNGYAPWQMSFALPLGALAFWIAWFRVRFSPARSAARSRAGSFNGVPERSEASPLRASAGQAAHAEVQRRQARCAP